jgi:hypothetical protein
MKKTTSSKNKFLLWVTLTMVAVVGGYFAYQNPDSKVAEVTINETHAMYESLSPQAKALYYQQSNELTKPVPERLVELDQLTIGCFGPSKILSMSTAEGNLGGQCCGALKDFGAYEIQLESLRNFIEENGNIDLIPKDPYDLSIEQVQKLIVFDSTITFTSDQQNVYDGATQMSHHGGPCCCKCWKWYMMSGLAKKLIASYDWDEHQIAELWDLSSSCGHDEDTNMAKHYDDKNHDH